MSHERGWILGACAAALALGVVHLIRSSPLRPAALDVPSSATPAARARDVTDEVGPSLDVAVSRTPVPGEGLDARAVLTVLDDGERPVDGALVHVEADEGWVLVGTTSAEGPLLFEGGRGVVRHPGYLPRDFEVPPRERRTLVLERGGAIEGRVTGLDPEGLAECRVVARERSDGAPRLIEDLEQGSPRVAEAAGCRPDGSFRLTGVRPGRQYVVEGLLRGMASAPKSVTAGTAESPAVVVLEIIEVWGAQVVFTGLGGDRLHGPDRVDLSRSSSAAHFRAELPPGFRYATEVSGLSLNRLSGGKPNRSLVDGRYRVLVLMTPDPTTVRGPIPERGPTIVWFSFQLPGYEPSSGEVHIRPYRENPPILEDELTPRAASFGALDLEFSGGEYLDEFDTRAIGAEYELRLEEAGGERLAVKYSVPLRGQERLDGIPAGTYDVVFEGLGKSLKVVPEGSPVRIGPDSTPRLTVELGAFGSIEVEAIQADGTPYDSGPMQVQLITETEPGLGRPMFYHLPGPPYVIRHVAPGPHFLVLLTPVEQVHADSDAVPRDTVLVTEGKVVTARFFLP